jgi:EAL and modified HD-GYP domain-containing signal transduction protein
MLAERVETQSQFEQARDQGFVYFQGYFFRRPEMMGTHDMPANRLNYIRMLQEVSRPELDVPSLEKLVKEEASVCYRLLRYLNSAVFGFKKEIHSVRHALSISWRTRFTAMGALDCGGGGRTRQDQRSGAGGPGAGTVLRADRA